MNFIKKSCIDDKLLKKISQQDKKYYYIFFNNEIINKSANYDELLFINYHKWGDYNNSS
jgi:hypothetical protein